MLKQRFVFAVSLFAILAVGNVWAGTASGDAVKTAHDVYTDLSTTETGIAGVSYVNKMVNAAGAAAQDAENHAASAGASALSAAAAASAAQTAANNAQTTANNVANKQDKSTAAYQMGNASGGWTAMTTAQQDALNSGITSTKVATYDAYAANKEAVANKLTSTATTTISDTNKDTLYPTVGKVQAMVNALDVSDTAVSGQYVSAVSETDGKITVTRASLPTVGNATLTIQRNGTTVDTFTANATSNKTINITDNDTTYTAGTNITISDGVISAKDTVYTLPDATTTVKGGVIVGDNISVSSGKISVPVATSGALGVVKTGTNITNNSGTISVTTIATPTEGSGVPLTSGGAYTALAAKEASANKVASSEAATTIGKTVAYPTVSFMETYVGQMTNGLVSDVGDVEELTTENTDSLVDAINEVDAEAAAKLATVSSTGSGVVKTVVKDGTTVKVTAGTVATADIADAAVTVAKTTGLYGVIPSGSQGNTAATAFIWVE